jgi:hypothetical protein
MGRCLLPFHLPNKPLVSSTAISTFLEHADFNVVRSTSSDGRKKTRRNSSVDGAQPLEQRDMRQCLFWGAGLAQRITPTWGPKHLICTDSRLQEAEDITPVYWLSHLHFRTRISAVYLWRIFVPCRPSLVFELYVCNQPRELIHIHQISNHCQ